MGSSPAKRTISPGNGAISSVGESACLTSKRSLVRVQYRPPGGKRNGLERCHRGITTCITFRSDVSMVSANDPEKVGNLWAYLTNAVL